MAHDVFISYSTQDKATADAICANLEARRIRCWIAPRDIPPGNSYGSAIIDAINGARAMVLVFSSSANQSAFVLNEVERAVSKGLYIIPFRIEDVKPSKDMEFFVSRQHWLDAMTAPLEQHIVRLADTIGAMLASAGAAPPQPITAPLQHQYVPPHPPQYASAQPPPIGLPENLQKWAKIRMKSKKIYIVTRGILGFGLPLSAFALCNYLVFSPPATPSSIITIVLGVLISLFVWGLIIGNILWYAKEGSYKRKMRKLGISIL